MEDCVTCRAEANFSELAVRDRVAYDGHWRVAHAFGTSLAGWLVVLPRRHVTAVAELTDGEAASLGTWLVRVSRALHEVTGCAKTYVAQFAEAEGFAHVHFHVVPRAVDLAVELRGPGVFAHLGGEPLGDGERDAVASRLAAVLAAG